MEDLNTAVKNALKKNDTSAAVTEIKEHFKKQKDIPLNIGITGESGSGKSTFINALKGVDADDQGAAPTGVTETTMNCTPYPHPKYSNVTLWDLPGVGTPNFPADTYLELVGFKKFDSFIIISANRFRENDVKLAQEIQRMKKKFYFVRSKIDHDLNDEKNKENFSKKKTLAKIRESCVEGFKKEGIESPQVFLVSSFELRLYDFPLLQQTLERDLPAHKRDVLLFAMPNISLEIINKKKEAFQAEIPHHAFRSAVVAAVPLPGFSTPIDINSMIVVVTEYVDGFGLDKPSLEKLAASTGVSYNDLCAVIKSELAKEKITKDLIMKMLSSLAGTATLKAVEVFKWIPIFGPPTAIGISYTETSRALNHFLNTLAEDAHSIFKRALTI